MEEYTRNVHEQAYIEELKKKEERDFARNWVNSSVFLFYLQVFCIVAFVLGGCYSLYKHRYPGKPNVEVPANTQYTPQYK
ncbi:MAG TPA: hypothetical protein VD996_12785 [Chitinophagaceae bacterium]|nr:hypothetical protein [Chitinophagaceae bacterium]